MAPEANDNSDKPEEAGNAGSPENAPCCGPGCDCGKPVGDGNKKLKIAVCLAVILAVCGILLYKTTNARQNAACVGTPLPSISALDNAASRVDTVFLIVPDKDNAPASTETGAVLAAVERTLRAKGIRTGVFTLQAGSADYPAVAASVSPPGIAILTKGAGMGIVSGNITETNLMQAYVASTRGGGCCPPGGGAAAPCN